MGWPLTIIVLVTLDRESERILDDFRRAIARVPEVIGAWYVTGEHDFVLRMVARDMSSFDKQISDLLYSKPFIRSFKTLVTFRNLKPLSGIPSARSIEKIDQSGDP
jgi:Lrp/AsnC family leucine-responsive transcriptional regulator